MRQISGSVLLTVALLGSAGLATACGQSGSSAIASLSPGKAASLIPSKSGSITSGAAENASTAPASPAPAVASPSGQSSAPQTSAAQTSAARTPTVQGSAPQATPTVARTSRGSGSSLLWLWIVIGVTVLGGGIALIAYSARRRSAAAADWRTRVIDVYAEGQALHDAIWTSAGRGQSADGAASSARSSGIELRADKLTQDLYALRESAPDEVQHARIVDVLVALQAVRFAMNASADLAGRLAAFQSALRGLRASADPSSSSTGLAGSL